MTDREFEKKVREAEIERRAHRMSSKMIADRLLEMDLPEEAKMAVRALEAAKDVDDAIHGALDTRALAFGNVDTDNLKKWCFFLSTMTTQIKAFAENNPIVKEEKEE